MARPSAFSAEFRLNSLRKHQGRGREDSRDGKWLRTRAFTELVSHYLFQDRFGRPGKGNDKGKVEGLVKFSRANDPDISKADYCLVHDGDHMGLDA